MLTRYVVRVREVKVTTRPERRITDRYCVRTVRCWSVDLRWLTSAH